MSLFKHSWKHYKESQTANPVLCDIFIPEITDSIRLWGFIHYQFSYCYSCVPWRLHKYSEDKGVFI